MKAGSTSGGLASELSGKQCKQGERVAALALWTGAALKRYEFMPHTGEAKFRAYGGTLGEAFGNAALALASLMYDPDAVADTGSREVRVGGRDLQRLLLRFLEEVLFLAETEAFLTVGFDSVEIEESAEGYSLAAGLRGTSSVEDCELHGEVKAITYSEMKVEQGDSPCVQVVVDV